MPQPARSPPRVNDGKIADILRHLKLGARQHHALRGLSIDEREDVRNIAHAGFTEGQRGDGDRQ
jgi:hypothetical protein